MNPIQPTISLTPEQVAFFHEHGYLALEAITTPAEVAMMRAVYDRIFAQRAGRAEGNQFDLAGIDEEGREAALPQILNPVKYAPELRDTLARANALAVSRQLLSEDAQAMGDHAIFKPARHGAATPWHQDEAYWNADMEYCSLSVWVPLQEATVANGCMQFIPGSHQLEVLPHHCINYDPRIHGLELDDGQASLRDPAICPLPPGGATFHLNRTLHTAGPNRSNVPRRAYIMGFGRPPRPRAAIGLPPRRFPWNDMKTTAREQRRQQAENQDAQM